jgi:hypothetical protein
MMMMVMMLHRDRLHLSSFVVDHRSIVRHRHRLAAAAAAAVAAE